MKIKINKIISIVVLAALVLTPLVFMTSSVFAAVPDEPHAGDAMWIEPSNITLSTATHSVGYRFNVTVWINLTISSASWQFKVAYDKNHLNATGAGYTAGEKSDFYSNITTIPLPFSFASLNGTHNFVLGAESWLMGSNRGPGYGTLAWIEFEVMVVPPEGEAYTSKIAMDDVSPTGETYVQDPDAVKIQLNSYESTYVIPEFIGFLSLVLIICLTTIAMLSIKRRSYISRR